MCGCIRGPLSSQERTEIMRGRMTPGRNDRCLQCMMRKEHCVCDCVPMINSPIPILVVRHWKERNKPSNTARLANLAIPNLRIVDYGAPEAAWSPNILNLPEPALLFPGTNGPLLDYVPQTIVVVDGSWPQARKLVNKLPELAAMPRIEVAQPVQQPVRLRQPPIPEGMSTIEAIARLLDHLSGPGAGAPLDSLYQQVVTSTIAARGRPIR